MYTEKDLVRVAKRKNNKKRNYLVINQLQGKHIPVKGKTAFKMFDELADLLKKDYANEKLLLIGFAETATAIGARVAVQLNSLYIQTTREQIPDVEYLYFSEEHSHATEQKLVKNDIDSCINDIDRIIFIEDEVTTGNTILNIIRIIQKTYHKNVSFSVASLLNGMDEHALKTYEEQDINLHYLVKTQHDKYSAMADLYKQEGTYHVMKNAEDIPEYNELLLNHYQNARRLVNAGEYEKACDSLWTQLIEKEKGSLDYESILVYENLKDVDLSYEFIEAIEEQFEMENEIVEEVMEGKGIDEIKKIVHTFNISDINFVKPGIGETTRVLLRRVPWKVLIDEKYKDDIALRHIIRLAEEKNVPVEYYPLVHYKCCGIIKKMADV